MKFIVTMRSLITLIIVCFQLPLFAQSPSISGATEVCANVPIRYTIKDPCSTMLWGNIQGPGQYIIVNKTNSYMDVQFPASNVEQNYIINLGYSCAGASGSGTSLAVVVKRSGVQATQTVNVPCHLPGQIEFGEAKWGTPTWSNTGEWPTVKGPYDVVEIPGQPSTTSTRIVYDLTNPKNGTVKVTFTNECTAAPQIQKTFNVVRTTSNSLPAPEFDLKPVQQCENTTSTFSVKPYANAESYTWTSSQPGVTFNQGGSTITIPAASNGNTVTVKGGSAALKTNISVTVKSVCGTSIAATTPLEIGRRTVTVNGPATAGPGEIGDYISSPVLTGATYEWQPGGSIIRTGDGTYKVRVQWPASVGGGPTTVGVLITNHPQTCGGFILAYKDVYVVGSDLLSISPNPSSTNVNVSLQRNVAAKSIAAADAKPTQINEIMIVDKFNNIKKIIKYPVGTTNISVDVSNLPADMYILRIRSNDTWTSKQIIVGGH